MRSRALFMESVTGFRPSTRGANAPNASDRARFRTFSTCRLIETICETTAIICTTVAQAAGFAQSNWAFAGRTTESERTTTSIAAIPRRNERRLDRGNRRAPTETELENMDNLLREMHQRRITQIMPKTETEDRPPARTTGNKKDRSQQPE